MKPGNSSQHNLPSLPGGWILNRYGILFYIALLYLVTKQPLAGRPLCTLARGYFVTNCYLCPESASETVRGKHKVALSEIHETLSDPGSTEFCVSTITGNLLLSPV
eukprot:sb/3477833/